MKTIATIVLAAVIFCGFGMINNVADGGVIMVTETFTPTVEIVTPTIEEPTSTGGGSGGSGGGITLPELPDRQTNIGYNSDGLDINVNTEVEEAWEHLTKWTDMAGNEYSDMHIHPQQVRGDANLYLNQDRFTYLGEKMYVYPYSTELRIYRNDDKYWNDEEEGIRFQISGEMQFLFTSDADEIANWPTPPGSNYYYNMGGINLSASIEMHHQYDYVQIDQDSDEWTRILTDDIRASMDFRLEDGKIDYAGLGIGDLYWWGDDVLGMRVDIDFSAFYTGSDVEAFKAAVPMESQHAPEPATMILLASGGLVMLKRRLRSRRLQKS